MPTNRMNDSPLPLQPPTLAFLCDGAPPKPLLLLIGSNCSCFLSQSRRPIASFLSRTPQLLTILVTHASPRLQLSSPFSPLGIWQEWPRSCVAVSLHVAAVSVSKAVIISIPHLSKRALMHSCLDVPRRIWLCSVLYSQLAAYFSPLTVAGSSWFLIPNPSLLLCYIIVTLSSMVVNYVSFLQSVKVFIAEWMFVLFRICHLYVAGLLVGLLRL